MKRSELFFSFILVPVDVAMIIASFVIAYYLRLNLESYAAFAEIGLKEYLRYSVYLIPIWIALFAGSGLYYIKTSRNFLREISRIANASSVAMLFLIVGIFLSKILFFSRLILIFTWLVSIIMLSLGRLIVHLIQKYLLRYGVGQRRVLLIGDNQASEKVVRSVCNKLGMGYKVIGVLNGDTNISKHGLKIIGSVLELSEKIKDYRIDEVILTDMAIGKGKMMDIIQTCSDHNVVFKYIPDTLSLITMNVTSELIGSMPVIQLNPIPLDGWGRIIKRLIDIFFSLLALIILSPVFIIITILEVLTSKGPVFYSHLRVGRDGKQFRCFKFRSMYIDKCDFSEGGTKWTTRQDEETRITPLGKVIRKTNLDELPQFLNIFKGDMSFVGPRPEQPNLVQKFETEIPEYFRRHRVKAGLTGWAQVNGLKGDTSIRERVKYDIFYIENWSLWFDLKIIVKTLILIFNETFAGKSEYRNRP